MIPMAMIPAKNNGATQMMAIFSIVFIFLQK
jgi:hypothetical protein